MRYIQSSVMEFTVEEGNMSVNPKHMIMSIINDTKGEVQCIMRALMRKY